MAAATENHDDGEDYNPGAVIVKEIAKAVVVHICSSEDVMAAFVRSIHTMRKGNSVCDFFIRKTDRFGPIRFVFYFFVFFDVDFLVGFLSVSAELASGVSNSNTTSPSFIASLPEKGFPRFEIKP